MERLSSRRHPGTSTGSVLSAAGHSLATRSDRVECRTSIPGHSDIPLDSVGLAQAQRAAVMLATLNPTKIVSSDLERARVTAQALWLTEQGRVTIDSQLRETYAGGWEGWVARNCSHGLVTS